MRTHQLGLLLLIVAAPAALRAQDACGGYMHAPPVGSWAEYQVSKEGEPEIGLRFAIVGTEQREGREMQWLEMAITPEDDDDPVIMKLLVPGYPFEPEGLEEIIMKAGDNPAMNMGGPMMSSILKSIGDNPGLSIAEACRKMEDAGEETVTVAAGTLQTHHYRNTESGAEAWLSSDVPFGMVRSTDGEYTSELIAHGEGAETAITETPQDPFGSP
ncbi:MAG: hypothetical protein ACREMD_02355 [Gemmatimonadota bacterium]